MRLILLAAGVVWVAGGVALIALEPTWLGGGESDNSSIRDLIIAVGTAAGPVITIWRMWEGNRQSAAAERHAAAAEQQAAAAQRQADTAQLTLLDERCERGLEQLRSDDLSECLTGIDALRGLAEEYPREYHIRIMTLLCSFVRRPGNAVGVPLRLHLPAEYDSSSSERRRKHELREDVQAAMDVICTCHARQLRLGGKAGSPLDLSGARLQGLRLRDTSLFGAELRDADLTDAGLAQVDLRGARLERAILASAGLWGSDLTASRHIPTSLTRADLTNARLIGSQMGGVSLRNANLTGTRFVNRPGLEGPTGAAVGLTQGQLDRAFADPDKPPRLGGVKDRETGEQLVPPQNPTGWERYERRKGKS